MVAPSKEMPLELALKYNGWADRRVIELFVRFSRVCFERFGAYVKYWLNFNEIDSLIRHSFTTAGIIPELCGARGELAACYQAAHHQFVAGARVTKLMRELVPGAKLGPHRPCQRQHQPDEQALRLHLRGSGRPGQRHTRAQPQGQLLLVQKGHRHQRRGHGLIPT